MRPTGHRFVPCGVCGGCSRTGDWPASVEGDVLTARYSVQRAQRAAPWHLYRHTLHTAVGVATAEPHGATRWDFAH